MNIDNKQSRPNFFLMVPMSHVAEVQRSKEAGFSRSGRIGSFLLSLISKLPLQKEDSFGRGIFLGVRNIPFLEEAFYASSWPISA